MEHNFCFHHLQDHYYLVQQTNLVVQIQIGQFLSHFRLQQLNQKCTPVLVLRVKAFPCAIFAEIITFALFKTF